MNEKMYVLQHKSGEYFKEQNLYLGSAILTKDIDSAAQMTMDEAEGKYVCMNEKDDWKIFRVVIGLQLGQESTRHIKAARKAELEKELAAIGEIFDYRTSKRIKYATDEWGGRDETHLEIEWNGRTLMVDITDERIHVVGCFFDVDKHSMNAMDITPHVFEQNAEISHGDDSATPLHEKS